MPWNVIIEAGRSPSGDVAVYRFFRDGVLMGEVPSPAAGDVSFTALIQEAEVDVLFEATAVDGALNESPKVGLRIHLDSQAPAAPGPLRLVSATWVP
jgi:hypothetical protein